MLQINMTLQEKQMDDMYREVEEEKHKVILDPKSYYEKRTKAFHENYKKAWDRREAAEKRMAKMGKKMP